MFYNLKEANQEVELFEKEISLEFCRQFALIARCIQHGQFYLIPEFAKNFSEILNYDFIPSTIEKFSLDPEEMMDIIGYLIAFIQLEEQYSDPKEDIPSNIKDLSNEIMYHIARYPELMHTLNPRLFEELIERIFIKFKVKTELTKQTRDGGYDIIAIDDTTFSKNKYIVECKRHALANKVDVSIVRHLYGVKVSSQVTKGLLVTSSFFTKDAIEFAKQHSWELELFDYNDIVKWLNLYWK